MTTYKKIDRATLIKKIYQHRRFASQGGLIRYCEAYAKEDKTYVIYEYFGQKRLDLILRNFRHDEKSIKYVASKVLSVLQAIHEKGIVYNVLDLVDNVLVGTKTGIVKLDFMG